MLSGEDSAPGEWVVVYLAGASLAEASTSEPEAALLHSSDGGLHPAVLAVPAGQGVTLASDDGLYHRFFSSSRPQGFEPVDVPSDESRELSLTRPGVVRVYCSLHPQERSTIVVTPSRHFSVLQAPGGYSLRGIPAGDYALHAWSEAHHDEAHPVRVTDGESTIVEIELGSRHDS